MPNENPKQETLVEEQQEQEKVSLPKEEILSEKKIERIEPSEQVVYKKVGSIQFSLLSPKMIKKMASAKVVTPELYDKEGYPVDGGLMDIRLGVIDPGLRCKTCGGKLKECNGHFGYIELARPLLHIKYIDMVLAFLRATCRECGEILLDQEELDKVNEDLTRVELEGGLTARRD